MNRDQNDRRWRRDRGDQDYGRQSEQFSDADSRYGDDNRDYDQMGEGGRDTYGQSDQDSFGRGYGASYGSSFDQRGGQRNRGSSDRGYNNDRSFDDDRSGGERGYGREQGYSERDGGYSSGGFGPSSFGGSNYSGRENRGFSGSGSDDFGGGFSGSRGDYGSGRGSSAYSASGGSYGQNSYGQNNHGQNRSGQNSYGSFANRGRDGDQGNRGFFERAGDEVASWFGDEDAARRRENDHSGRGPSNYTRSDERILEDACDHLTVDRAVDAQNIQVTVQKGEITLDGTVSSRQQKRRAEDCVHDISGVKHVQNNLRINDRNDWSRGDNDRPGSTMGSGTTGISGGYGSTDRDADQSGSLNRSDSTTGTLA